MDAATGIRPRLDKTDFVTALLDGLTRPGRKDAKKTSIAHLTKGRVRLVVVNAFSPYHVKELGTFISSVLICASGPRLPQISFFSGPASMILLARVLIQCFWPMLISRPEHVGLLCVVTGS